MAESQSGDCPAGERGGDFHPPDRQLRVKIRTRGPPHPPERPTTGAHPINTEKQLLKCSDV